MLFIIITTIVVAIVLISKFKINTFLVLLVAAVGLGLMAGFSPDDAIKTIKAGFGHTLEKIGLLIIFGVILGEILDKTHATQSIAHKILTLLGQNRTELAMLCIGFLVGLPIFCDSGFIILSGLLFHLRSKNNFLALVLCLAGGLYSVHCLVPPHPGITAATSQLSLDFGKTMLYGTFLAIPSTIIAYFWAKYINKKQTALTQWKEADSIKYPSLREEGLGVGFHQSFLPIWLPISLMAVKAIWTSFAASPNIIISFIGEPVVALFIGILASLPLIKESKIEVLNKICDDSFSKSGHILIIVAAGGMFGEVVKKILTDNPETASSIIALSSLGLLVPYLLTFLFKTAQGSSTVAIISAASILQPLLPQLNIDPQMALFAMGAGSMAISHTNDAYFWVVTRFSKIDTNLSLKTYTPLTILMSITTILTLLIINALR